MYKYDPREKCVLVVEGGKLDRSRSKVVGCYSKFDDDDKGDLGSHVYNVCRRKFSRLKPSDVDLPVFDSSKKHALSRNSVCSGALFTEPNDPTYT
jgi:hypothetical protein